MKSWIFVIILIEYAKSDPTPIVLWHGDTCCVNSGETYADSFQALLQKYIPGVYVLSIKVGNETVEDLYNSYFMETNSQIEFACKTIEADPNLQDEFNAVGFSQGGQFLRAVIQRCGHRIGRVKNLITLGSQHQGVYGNPVCGDLIEKSCEYTRELINMPYDPWVQREIVLATYWHDPLHEEDYKESSQFLSDINNELFINQTYVDNLNKVDNFVMVMFKNDIVTQPRGSSWFGFYTPGQDEIVQTLRESDLYQEDRLGLKKMDEEGKLVFLSFPGRHLKIPKRVFYRKIVQVYLAAPSS